MYSILPEFIKNLGFNDRVWLIKLAISVKILAKCLLNDTKLRLFQSINLILILKIIYDFNSSMLIRIINFRILLDSVS